MKNRTVKTESREYVIPHELIDRDNEATRSHRVRLSFDYIDTWDEMTPVQRGELISSALETRRSEGWAACG